MISGWLFSTTRYTWKDASEDVVYLVEQQHPHVDGAHQRQCHLLEVYDSRSRVMRRSEHGQNLRVETARCFRDRIPADDRTGTSRQERPRLFGQPRVRSKEATIHPTTPAINSP